MSPPVRQTPKRGHRCAHRPLALRANPLRAASRRRSDCPSIANELSSRPVRSESRWLPTAPRRRRSINGHAHAAGDRATRPASAQRDPSPDRSALHWPARTVQTERELHHARTRAARSSSTSRALALSLRGDGHSAKTATKRFCEAPITLKRPSALTLLIARARFTESAKGKLVARRGRKASGP